MQWPPPGGIHVVAQAAIRDDGRPTRPLAHRWLPLPPTSSTLTAHRRNILRIGNLAVLFALLPPQFQLVLDRTLQQGPARI